MTAPYQDGAPSNDAPRDDIAGPYDEMSRVLAELPRPRPVRMSRRGKIIGMVVLIALLASMGIYAAAGMLAQRAVDGQIAGPSQFPVYALSIAFMVVFVIVMLNMIGKQKRLLSEGEMATARVTRRSVARNGPNICYEFSTTNGERFSHSVPDASRQLSVGMSVPVFYDPLRPKKQLALCASFYEVVLPGKN